MKRRTLLVTVSVIALAAAGTGIYVAPLMADPAGERIAGRAALGRASGQAARTAPAPQRMVRRGGTVTMRAAQRTQVAGVSRSARGRRQGGWPMRAPTSHRLAAASGIDGRQAFARAA